MNDNLKQRTVGGESYSEDEEKSLIWTLFDRFATRIALPSFLVSFLFHLFITLGAGWIFLGAANIPVLTINSGSTAQPVEDLELDNVQPDDPNEQLEESTELEEAMAKEVETPVETELTDPTETTEINTEVTDPVPTLSETGNVAAESTAVAANGAKGIDGRKGKARKNKAAIGGGTDESEEAVELGLKWLVRHQSPDGGWDLNHQLIHGERGRRLSPDPGANGVRIGATGLALLPFLGAGYDHKQGKYRKDVSKGIAFLIRNGRGNLHGKNGIAFYEPDIADAARMYSHTLATLALIEAYLLTKDKNLLPICRAAVRHIIAFQDPERGGWKYRFQSGSDTSVTGWVILTLKNAELAGIQVPDVTYKRAKRFLNSVQSQGGAAYGYEMPETSPSGSLRAVGLLCRMYGGWKRDNPVLAKGVNHLSKLKPDTRYFQKRARKPSANIYYNYYTTMVMHHYGGSNWKEWNPVMRDFLVRTQAKNGPSKGSWFMSNQVGSASSMGGRLYVTAMAILTLEVYYRYPPIYRNQASSDLIDGFDLD